MSHALVYTIGRVPDEAERGLEGVRPVRYRYGFTGCEITNDLDAVIASSKSILTAYKEAGFSGELILIKDGMLPASVALPSREELMRLTASELSKRYGVKKGKKADMVEAILSG